MNRRDFLQYSGSATLALGIGDLDPLSSLAKTKNKIPAWKGFNLLDFFNPNPNQS